MKLLLGLLIFAILAYAGAAVLLFTMQERFLFPAPPGDVPAPPPGFERVTIKSGTERLPAYWHPPEPGETTVVRFHGNGDAIGFQRPIGEALAAADFGVLLAEYRGYPGATGSPSEAGLFADGEAAFDFARERTDGSVALYAHSLGAAVAVHVATVRNVSRLVLEAPFESMRSEVARRVSWLPVDRLLRHPFRTDERLERVKAPTLVIHGGRDGVIDSRSGERVAKRLGAPFVLLKDAGHNDLWSHGALERAVAFLRERR